MCVCGGGLNQFYRYQMFYLDSTIIHKQSTNRKQRGQQLKATAIPVLEQENMRHENKTENKVGSRTASDYNARLQTGFNM